MASSASKLPQAQPVAPEHFYSLENQPHAANGHTLLPGKPPLPPKLERQPYTDSELSDISDGDQGSDFVMGRHSDSDLSEDSSSRWTLLMLFLQLSLATK